MTVVYACTDAGTLTINNVSMHIEDAWAVTNLHELWVPTADRGENRIIPGVRGRRALPWRTDQSVYALQLAISGINDVNGSPHPGPSPWYGWWTNVRYLQDNVVQPPSPPTASVVAEFAAPDGTLWVADVQPRRLTPSPTETDILLAVLDLVVPYGWLVADVS